MKKFKFLALFLSVMIFMSLVTGCSTKGNEPDGDANEQDIILGESDQEQEEETSVIEIEDKFGNKAVIDKEITKIVSLAPSNTEVLFALGLGDKVVGVTSNCDYPQEATTKEVVAEYNASNLERIVELEPDLVLLYGPGAEEDNKILKDAGIQVLGFISENMEDILEDIRIIGKATNKESEAEEIVKDILGKKDEIVNLVKGQDEVKVFYEIWHDPLMGAGKGSFMDQLITLAGGINIANDTDGAYPQYDLEQLIERNPEIYILSHDMPEKTVESVKERPGYSAITAIQNDRVHVFYDNDADVVSRPGPRIGEALELVAKAIHPQLFK